jgi:hypothetical protein
MPPERPRAALRGCELVVGHGLDCRSQATQSEKPEPGPANSVRVINVERFAIVVVLSRLVGLGFRPGICVSLAFPGACCRSRRRLLAYQTALSPTPFAYTTRVTDRLVANGIQPAAHLADPVRGVGGKLVLQWGGPQVRLNRA